MITTILNSKRFCGGAVSNEARQWSRTNTPSGGEGFQRTTGQAIIREPSTDSTNFRQPMGNSGFGTYVGVGTGSGGEFTRNAGFYYGQ